MITVIGGSGFIGTRLCQNLADRQLPFEIVDLKVSTRFPDRTKIADIRDYTSLKKAVTGNSIINLAAVHRDDVRDSTIYYDTNVGGTSNICKVAQEKGIERILFTSTVAVYGFAESSTGESGAINPFNDYGKSKYQGENVLRSWFDSAPDRRALTIIRPTVVFGEGNRGNVYNLLRQIASGRFVMIGDGKNQKSMAYVGNLAAFIDAALHNTHGYSLYNYVDSPDMDMNTLVEKVTVKLGKNYIKNLKIPYWLGILIGYGADIFAHIFRKRLPISSIRVKKFCAQTKFSSAVPHLKWFTPPYSLAEAIEQTIDAEFLSAAPIGEVFYTE